MTNYFFFERITWGSWQGSCDTVRWCSLPITENPRSTLGISPSFIKCIHWCLGNFPPSLDEATIIPLPKPGNLKASYRSYELPSYCFHKLYMQYHGTYGKWSTSLVPATQTPYHWYSVWLQTTWYHWSYCQTWVTYPYWLYKCSFYFLWLRKDTRYHLEICCFERSTCDWLSCLHDSLHCSFF